MRQVLLRIPIPGTDHVLTLYGYGLAMCLGFLLAILTAARRAKRDGSPPEVIHNAALACFFGGVFGARAFFVIQNHDQFDSPLALLRIWEGGLTFYGGFLVATLATVAYLRATRRNVLYWLDVITPSMALGLAFGRVGCFLNGCCYGDVAGAGPGMVWPVGSIPWYHYAEAYLSEAGQAGSLPLGAVGGALGGALAAVWRMPAIHPSQAYSLVNALALSVVLSVMFRRRRRNGQILLTFVVLYGITRYLLEVIRADEPEVYLLGLPTLLRLVGAREAAEALPGLTISQNIAVAMVIGGGLLLWRLMKSRRPGLVVERDGS
ncbi:MAG: prolipoprotein diacylglyceryl transferase [Planctomycetota bacterium]|nr:prolipoprotein diacylglyceryl transferase [Planctomycetota bacterium]